MGYMNFFNIFNRWGDYNVVFVRPIQTMDDLLFNFQSVLPLLKEAFLKATSNM